MSEAIAQQLEKLKQKKAYKDSRVLRKAAALNAYREGMLKRSGDQSGVEEPVQEKQEEATATKSNRPRKKANKGKTSAESGSADSGDAATRDYRDAFAD